MVPINNLLKNHYKFTNKLFKYNDIGSNEGIFISYKHMSYVYLL